MQMADRPHAKGPNTVSQPGKPTAADITHNTIHLIWERPQFGSENVEFYMVRYQQVDADKRWMQKKSTMALNHISVSNLAAKTKYLFKVRALCEAGPSPESEMSDPIATRPRPLPAKAGRPIATKVTHDSIQLVWSCPESGAQDIKLYSVLFRRTDNPDWWQTQKTESAEPSLVVSGLTANAVYCFKVRAECEAGVCSDSDMSDPIQTSPPPVPARPNRPRASKVTHNSIQISWFDPDSITPDVECYSVLYRRTDGPTSQWQSQNTADTQEVATVSGLASKAVYCFKVRAEGKDGVCSESEMSDLIATNPLPVTMPGKPGAPIASEVTHNSIQLNWSRPESGTQDIMSYSVMYRRMDDPTSQWQTQTTADTQEVATVSGLAPKAVYCFKICIEGKDGVLSESEMSDLIATNPLPVTMPGKPGAPIASKVTHNSIQLNWSEPESGTHDITSYSVMYRRMDDPTSQWQTQTTANTQEVATVSGLAPKAVYCFKVRAEGTKDGDCSESEMSDLIATNPHPMVKPGQPIASEVTHNSIQLSWCGRKSGTQYVKFYSVLYRQMDDPSSQWQTQSTQGAQEVATVSGLAPKSVYCFKICAEGEDGVCSESEMSDPIATNPLPIAMPGIPGPPIASKVTHNSVQLSWSGPELGAQDIMYYSIAYRRMDDPSSQWQTQSMLDTEEVATVSGLAANAVYCFKVCAVGDAGAFSESEMSDLIPTKPHPIPGKPGQPFASNVTHNSIRISWSSPESGPHGIKVYSVVYRQINDPSSQWQTQNTQGIQEVATVSNLTANAVYCFKVRAVDEAGIYSESKMSDPIATNPHPIPGKPGQPMASKVTHNSVQLSWSESGSQDIKFYSVLYRRMDDPSSQWQTQSTQGSREVATVSGLASKAVYCFKIRAEGEDGICSESEMSELIATNPHPLAGKPGQPMASKVTHNSIQLSWCGPELGIQDIKFYSVLYRRMDDPLSQWQTQSTQGAQEVATVSGLAAKATYCFKIRAESEVGVSSESEMSDLITTYPHPMGKPSQPMASNVTHNSIQLSWFGPESGTQDIKFYSVLYRRMDDPSSQWQTQSTQGAQEVATVSGLAGKATYCFKIRAEGEEGVSSESEMSDFITTNPHPIPGKPGQPIVSEVTHNSIHLNWASPEFGAEGIKFYTVLYRRMDKPSSQWEVKHTKDAQAIATVSGLVANVMYCFKVRAECEVGVSVESEMSEPVATRPSPLPGRPGKPKATNVTHNSIDLIWSGPKQGAENVRCYSVSYRQANDPAECWEVKRTSGTKPRLVVSNLAPSTRYCFKVHAESDAGISPESEMNSDIQTHPLEDPSLYQHDKAYASKVITFQNKAKVRLAEEMLSSATLIERGPPAIYKLKLQEVTVDEGNQLKKCAIGKTDPVISAEEKVIMVLGATGAGKTTLINGMANYLFGVQWEDQFRFKIITDEGTGSDTSQAESQTKWITAYTFHHQKGSPLPYTLTVIDTPGFGDTGGLERDHRITEQIKRFFSTPPPYGIDHLNAIGFVTQAALARLTPTQKYIFDSILAVFGKDIASNIFMMATFADGGDPPVMAAIKAGNIPFCDLFKFNNSALYANCSDMFSKMFWEMGVVSFEAFFAHLMTVKTRSLRLTRMVLDEREHLEAIIQGLLPQIKAIMSTMDELQQEEKVLERLQLESSDLGSKKFTYTITTIQQMQVNLPTGEFVTNCRQCNRTCHYPCKVPDDAGKWGCAAMNWREAGERSVCQVCPGGCEWQKHCNNTFRIDDFEEHEERTLDDLLKRYKTVKGDKNAVKTTVYKIQQNVQSLKRKAFEKICEAQQILARLDEIALKPNPLNELDYIDLLIQSEEQECKPGYMKRLEYLQEARHNAELLYQVDEPVDAPQWLKESVHKAREQMIRRRRQFQQQESHPHQHPTFAQPPPKTGQEISTREQKVKHQSFLRWQHSNAIPSQPPQMGRRETSTEKAATVSSTSKMSNLTATNPHPIPGKPGQPIVSEVTHNSIHLNWASPKFGAEDIKFYTVLYRRMDKPSSQWQVQYTKDAQAVATVSGLVANVMYCFKVRTECEVGDSVESEMTDPVATRPSPLPGCPGKPKATNVTHNSVDLIWSGPKHGAENVRCYSVSYRQANDPAECWEVKRTNGTKPRLVVSNLAPSTRYCFKVHAESDAGISPESEINSDIQTHPLEAPPVSQPGKPYVSSQMRDNKIILKWNKPSYGFQDVKYYTVSYYAVEDHDFPGKWKTKTTAGLIESTVVTGLNPSVLYCFKVRAESDAGYSSYSESSDPIQLNAPPAPSQPGKPTASDKDITHNSILLKWAKPVQSGDYVKCYSISYCRQYDPVDQWQTKLSDGARTAVTVSGLDPNTEYSFKVHAVSDSGISIDSEASTFQTKAISNDSEASTFQTKAISNDSEVSTFQTETEAKVCLAEEMLSSAIMIEQGPPAIYKLKLQEVVVDEGNQLKKCAVGKTDPIISAEEKVIMVLGATGAGKTTLINGMANYLFGVQWEDQFRFKVITDEETGSDTSQAESQTKWITAYTFHHQKGSPLPYTLTIIDTPGFGDTGGLQRDHRITEQIKHFFSTPPPYGIDHLNAIGFVTQAALARLTPTQRYIFDSILAVFGKDIASNIFMMATFADGGDPPVMAAIKAENIPFCDLFKFNNSALYANCSDMFSKMFWEMGVVSFETFFAHLTKVETRSLRLTRMVLDEREHLEAIIQGLLPQIKFLMSIIDRLQQEEKFLERLQLESSDLGSKEFTYTVTTIQQKRVDLPAGEFITNCRQCNRTCHYPCKVPDDGGKWGCAAMNWREAGERSVCQVCPRGCEWQKHCNNNFRIEHFEEREENTLDDLLQRYKTVRSDENAVQTTVYKIQKNVQSLKRKVFEKICEAQQILARLDEIALKPNPLTELDYIDLLIQSEEQECKPGYMKRLEYLQEARHNAELLYQVDEPVDAPQWLKESVHKAREQMIRRRRQFQQQESHPHQHPTFAQPPPKARQEVSTSGKTVNHQHSLQQQHSDPYSKPTPAQPQPKTKREASTRDWTVSHQHPLQRQHSDPYSKPTPAQPQPKTKREASTRDWTVSHQQQQRSKPIPAQPLQTASTNRVSTSRASTGRASTRDWTVSHQHPLQQQHSNPIPAHPLPTASTSRASTGREQTGRHQHSSQQQHSRLYPNLDEPPKSTGSRWWPFSS